MSDATIEGTVKRGHLYLAANYAFERWFPCNTPTARALATRLGHGEFISRPDRLIEELKGDVALFTRAVAGLALVHESSPDRATLRSPIELISSAPAHLLARIITETSGLSDQPLYAASAIQLRRLRESLVSASAAELLAPTVAVSPDEAYACALFRQLGLTLIAWNYPNVYRRALAQANGALTVDAIIGRTLGFTPRLLGITLARQWNLTPTVRAALGDPAATSAPELDGEQAARLEKICRIGEALARAADPTGYPVARGDWERARDQFNEHLGRGAFARLREKLRLNCRHYLAVLPEFFSTPPPIEEEARDRGARPSPQLERNLYIRHCPPAIQGALHNLYETLTPGSVQKRHLDVLCQTIIPTLGFRCGAIYLVDPEEMELSPRLVAGSTPLAAFAPVQIRNAGVIDSSPVLAAWRSPNPVTGANTSGVGWIAGALGGVQRAGVLYLEGPAELLTTTGGVGLIYFKAVRQALADCLDLY